MTDERELASHRLADETIEPAAAAVTPATTADDKPVIPPSDTIIDAEAFHRLEREMQTLPADQVTLPDGRKLSEVIAAREAAQAAEGLETSAAEQKAIAEPKASQTSSILPTQYRVIVTPAGDLVTAPVSPEPEKPKSNS